MAKEGSAPFDPPLGTRSPNPREGALPLNPARALAGKGRFPAIFLFSSSGFADILIIQVSCSTGRKARELCRCSAGPDRERQRGPDVQADATPRFPIQLHLMRAGDALPLDRLRLRETYSLLH